MAKSAGGIRRTGTNVITRSKRVEVSFRDLIKADVAMKSIRKRVSKSIAVYPGPGGTLRIQGSARPRTRQLVRRHNIIARSVPGKLVTARARGESLRSALQSRARGAYAGKREPGWNEQKARRSYAIAKRREELLTAVMTKVRTTMLSLPGAPKT